MLLCADPKAQYLRYATEINSAIDKVLQSGWYILGEHVSGFEREFAELQGVNHCVGVANGTDALAIALRACGVSPGDEVITVSHSAVATVAAIEQIGAVPVFCDICYESRCMNPQLIKNLISDKTKAIVPVHIYGHPADVPAIKKIAHDYELFLIEDCAQAHGASLDNKLVGTFGDIAAFSFYPTKNLGALGDGGAIITNNKELADKVNYLRQYGWKERYISSVPGVNSRLDEIQAAILRVKLPHLLDDNEKRRSIADQYDMAFTKTRIGIPIRANNIKHAMHLYVIELDGRDSLRKHLATQGVQAALHYPFAIHQQPAYASRSLKGATELPNTEKLYQRLLSLPLYPELTSEQVDKVIKGVYSWLECSGSPTI